MGVIGVREKVTYTHVPIHQSHLAIGVSYHGQGFVEGRKFGFLRRRLLHMYVLLVFGDIKAPPDPDPQPERS